MDYALRNEYEQYLKANLTESKVYVYLKVYDTLAKQYIYQQIQTLSGKRIYEWKYRNEVIFLRYYPDPKVAEKYEYVKNLDILVWDFTKKCSEVLKKQIFYTLSHIVVNSEISAVYRNNRLKA